MSASEVRYAHPLLLTELALLIGLDAPFGIIEGAAGKLDSVRQCTLEAAQSNGQKKYTTFVSGVHLRSSSAQSSICSIGSVFQLLVPQEYSIWLKDSTTVPLSAS